VAVATVGVAFGLSAPPAPMSYCETVLSLLFAT
jgi:hypothetical protein